MIVREFTKVFRHFDYLEESKVAALEAAFFDARDGFLWDLSPRNPKKTQAFIHDIVNFDLGLATGDVRAILTSLGGRMLVIGTDLGNAFIYERQRFYQIEKDDDEGGGSIIVVGYFPPGLEPLLGTRPLKDDQIYTYTGFFNSNHNLGYSLRSLTQQLAYAS